MVDSSGEIQEVVCNNCGSVWQIERHWEDSDIVAELWKCPLCASIERKAKKE